MANSYDLHKDPNALQTRSASEPGGDAALLVPNDGANLGVYAKALRIFVPLDLPEASVRMTPALAADDGDAVTLRFHSGLFYEPISVRKIWQTGTTAGIEIHGYTV